jgi:TonB family protein
MKIKIIILFAICSIGLFCCNNNKKDKLAKEKLKSDLIKEKKSHNNVKESQDKTENSSNSIKKEKRYIPPQVVFDSSYIDPMPRDPSLMEFGPIDQLMEGDELILEKQLEEEVFTIVEVNPEFNGGMNEMLNFLREHIIYPEDAKEIGIEGKVLIQFIVHKDGQLSDFKVIKKVYPSVDREALRVVQKMPKWIPGKNNGKIVSVRVVIPIIFKLS